jgi:hypothetical protein
MTRRAEPSEEELRSNIAKRMFIPAGGLPSTQETSSPSSNDKRMFIPAGGLPSHKGSSSSTSDKRVHTPVNLPLFKRPVRQHARGLLSHLIRRVHAVLGVNDAANEGGKHRHGGGGTDDDSTGPCTTGSSDLAWKVYGTVAYSNVNRPFYFLLRWQHHGNRHRCR